MVRPNHSSRPREQLVCFRVYGIPPRTGKTQQYAVTKALHLLVDKWVTMHTTFKKRGGNSPLHLSEGYDPERGPYLEARIQERKMRIVSLKPEVVKRIIWVRY